ncbi:MAG: YIP1 family protein, partial [Clostridia bacterium]|nr:YIP1 family protein [Deltaproteobacteria bacterium]
MSLNTDILDLLRDPHELMHEKLRRPPVLQHLAVTLVLPLICIRPAAVLLRSVATGRPVAGVVLGMSHLVLQLGCLVGLAVVLPTIVRQFRGQLSDRASFVLSAYASVPLWIAGCLYLAPEESVWLLFASRAAVIAMATYGIYLLHVGLEEAEVQARQ